MLRSERLEAFLSASKSNLAVLTDYVAMETYKWRPVEGTHLAMQVLAKYPHQVVVLNGTAKNAAMSGRLAGLQRRLIDEAQTRGFPEYIAHLQLAKSGHRDLQKQFEQHGEAARGHLEERMLIDAEQMGPTFDALAKEYSKEERAIIRNGGKYSATMVAKLSSAVLLTCRDVFPTVHGGSKWPPREQLSNTLLFRVILCGYLLAVFRGAHGGASGAKPETIRNDMVDAMFAAYGTFFDGLMSNEDSVIRIHNDARDLLATVFDGQVSRLPSERPRQK